MTLRDVLEDKICPGIFKTVKEIDVNYFCMKLYWQGKNLHQRATGKAII